MQHPNDAADDLEIIFGNVEELIERVDEAGADLLARVTGEIGVGLEQDLAGQARGVDRKTRGRRSK